MKDENITRVTLDPENPTKGKTDWKKFDALTDEEVHAAALADPDAQPLTEEELKEFKRVPNVKSIRKRLKLSQRQFANTFHLSVRTVQDWEQHRRVPDGTARAYLTAIAKAPELVMEALER